MEEPPSYHSILVLDRLDLSVDTALIRKAVEFCLVKFDSPPSEIRILLTTDAEVRRLNRSFRGIDEATDVLTFADDQEFSGDIAIAGPLANAQACLRGITLAEEVSLLAIHGTLHLLGFDDESVEDRDCMVEQMLEIAGKVGITKLDDWSSLIHSEAIL